VSTDLLKRTTFCLLSTFCLTTLLVSCDTSESRGEGPFRGLIRERIRARMQQEGQGSGSGLRQPTDSSAAGEVHKITSQGIERTYFLYTPSSYVSRPMPLVIGLHGGHTEPGRFSKTTGFNALADKEGFMVAYPVGVNQNWNDGRDNATLPKQNDVAFISAMIDGIQKIRKVDNRRIYAAGMSNGGFMTQRLVLCHSSNDG
jgi:polyhydroxybutyrate depolymerase